MDPTSEFTQYWIMPAIKSKNVIIYILLSKNRIIHSITKQGVYWLMVAFYGRRIEIKEVYMYYVPTDGVLKSTIKSQVVMGKSPFAVIHLM